MKRILLALVIGACGGGSKSTIDAAPGSPDAPQGSIDAAGADAAPGEDLDMQASDFECILRWDMAGGYRVTNKLGHDALSIAQSPTGGVFPVGTIIQIVPTEAMVKRRAGFSPATNDWEFFSLGVSSSGTTISKRGTTDVVNAFGGNCLGCHMKAMPQWDFVCATTHGCDPLPLSESQLVALQNMDPRCP
jgi:hypothetical protein